MSGSKTLVVVQNHPARGRLSNEMIGSSRLVSADMRSAFPGGAVFSKCFRVKLHEQSPRTFLRKFVFP